MVSALSDTILQIKHSKSNVKFQEYSYLNFELTM